MAALVFGNDEATKLILKDSLLGHQGTVSIIGDVTLAANTTTKMNFDNDGTTDLLDVQGTLTLAGDLELTGDAAPAAGTSFDFFDSFGDNPQILGAFGDIEDNFGNTPTGAVVNNGPNMKRFRVAWRRILSRCCAGVPGLIRV